MKPETSKRLNEIASVHPTAVVKASSLGRYVDIGEHVRLTEVDIGDYSYIARDADAIYADIGKFCSIAAATRINPGNHPMWRATQHHFTYRSAQYGLGAEDDASFFQWRRDDHVSIGHDVWLGHGAVILAGVKSAPAPSWRRGRRQQICRALHSGRRCSRETDQAAIASGARRKADRTRLVGLVARTC